MPVLNLEILKTSCAKCVFAQNNSCLLDKDTFIVNDKLQYTSGYCRHKRNKKWLGSKELDLAFLQEDIVQEENRLTASIVVQNNNFDNLQKTLNSIKEINVFTEVFVGLHQANKEFLCATVEALKSIRMSWRVEDMVHDESLTADAIHNFMFPNITNNWFIQLNSGDVVDYGMINAVSSDIVNANDNYIVYFLNDKYITNKFAFGELGGHHNTNYLEKLKQFSNWEMACKYI